MRTVKATNVQFSGVMPGGHASASWEVVVENAYLIPPPALREGEWVVLRDGGHELWEGEILSVKPTVEGSTHKLMVEGGGMMTVAAKRRDVVVTWAHRGTDGWIRRPGTPELGSCTFDQNHIVLSAPIGSTEDFQASALTNMLAAQFVLHDEVSDATIDYLSSWRGWDTTADAGHTWSYDFYAAETMQGPFTLLESNTGTSSGGAGFTVVPAAGTKSLLVVLKCNAAAYTTTARKWVDIAPIVVLSSGRTTNPRIDEAMVSLAMRPGIALSYTSRPVGPPMDDLRVGSATDRVSVATGLQQLADYHAQPFDWGFWDNRSFDVGPRLITPDNDSRVIVVGGGRPGLVMWDVAEYDEDVPDYACVLFGNKDSASYPEGWTRRLYRPTTPPDDNVKLETLDYSDRILTDAAAQALGDNLVGRAPAIIPPDYVFRVHAQLAKQGRWPGNNTDPTSTVQDIGPNRLTGTVNGCAYTIASGWGGSNSPADPACITLDGTGDYITFGDAASLNFGAGARTIVVWWNPAAVGAHQALFTKRSWSGATTGWSLLQLSTGAYRFEVVSNWGTGAYRGVDSSVVAVADQLQCIAAMYDGSEASLYVDGVDVSTGRTGSAGAYNSDAATHAALGCRDPGGTIGYYANGALVSAIAFPRGLSAAEIAQIANAGPVIYDRSLAKGNVVIKGLVQNRKGALIPAHHVRAGWWIQHLETGSGKPLYIAGHNVNMTDRRNALTIGEDWMEEQIGVRSAELLALPETVAVDPETGEPTDPDPWKNWRVPA